jgi:hypothetical protein
MIKSAIMGGVLLWLSASFTCPAFAQSQWTIATCGVIHKTGYFDVNVLGNTPPPSDAFTPKGVANHSKDISVTGDCLTVEAPNVTVNLEPGIILDGSGTGIGIHAMRVANGFKFFEDAATIRDFEIAIEVDASSSSVGESFDEPVSLTNNQIGILVKNAAKVSIAASFSFGLPQTCIKLQNVRSSTITQYSGFGSLSCESGIVLDQSSLNTITGNPSFGSLSSANVAVQIGKGSNRNTVTSFSVKNAGTGIEIQRGAAHNTIDSNTSIGSQKFDLLDQNPNCGSNVWRNNTFNQANPAGCIH